MFLLPLSFLLVLTLPFIVIVIVIAAAVLIVVLVVVVVVPVPGAADVAVPRIRHAINDATPCSGVGRLAA
jgi:hypothetical protein